MSRSKRESLPVGKDYWFVRGFLEKKGDVVPQSDRPGVNKKNKRIANKTVRQQVRKYKTKWIEEIKE